MLKYFMLKWNKRNSSVNFFKRKTPKNLLPTTTHKTQNNTLVLLKYLSEWWNQIQAFSRNTKDTVV